MFAGILVVACQPQATATPTAAAAAATVSQLSAPSPLPPTWTPFAAPRATETAAPTFTPRPSKTPLILPTPSWTPTATPSPTATPTNTPSATTIPPPPPADARNLLPNPSFEGGWYHINGIPELQVPNGWLLEWESGDNPLDPDPWNDWVRPESRVLSPDFLPPEEHDLFIWDGKQTVKIFKGLGALSFRLTARVSLQPGTYLLRVNIWPDLVVDYTANGEKIWAPDPLSGEVRLLAGDRDTQWLLPTFGQKNTLTHVFNVGEAGTIRVGVAARGRWAIENNGWFMDDWALFRVGGN